MLFSGSTQKHWKYKSKVPTTLLLRTAQSGSPLGQRHLCVSQENYFYQSQVRSQLVSQRPELCCTQQWGGRKDFTGCRVTLGEVFGTLTWWTSPLALICFGNATVWASTQTNHNRGILGAAGGGGVPSGWRSKAGWTSLGNQITQLRGWLWTAPWKRMASRREKGQRVKDPTPAVPWSKAVLSRDYSISATPDLDLVCWVHICLLPCLKVPQRWSTYKTDLLPNVLSYI